MRNTKQKEKECRIQKNARNMKNAEGKKLLNREDRLEEVKRRQNLK